MGGWATAIAAQASKFTIRADAKLFIFASGMSGRRLPLPKDMIGDNAEPDQKAQRRAYHK